MGRGGDEVMEAKAETKAETFEPLDGCRQARISWTTRPCTSVRR